MGCAHARSRRCERCERCEIYNYTVDLLPWWQRWYWVLAFWTWLAYIVTFSYVKRTMDPYFGSDRIGPWGIVLAPGYDTHGLGPQSVFGYYPLQLMIQPPMSMRMASSNMWGENARNF